jgi:hypothetical protein
LKLSVNTRGRLVATEFLKQFIWWLSHSSSTVLINVMIAACNYASVAQLRFCFFTLIFVVGQELL